MKEYEITKDMIKEAVVMSKDMGTLNGSLLEGQGNTWGFLGEIIAAKALAAEHKNTYDYDLITPLGHTVDVKTQRVSSIPRPQFHCNVNEHSIKQKCDYYAFVRLHSDLTTAWYLGKMGKPQFMQQAMYREKGSATTNFIFKFNCYSITIDELDSLTLDD